MSSPIVIEAIDHLVLTVADMDGACEFYGRVLVSCPGDKYVIRRPCEVSG